MIRHLGIAALITILTGCASVTTPPPAPNVQIPWKERQAALSRVQSWQINGKIAVKTAKDAGSASMDWIQHQSNFIISLMGPLGSNGLKLSGHPGSVTLVTSDGKHYTASSPEQLLAERWGFHLPVSNLKYWIRGLPVPDMAANTQFDAAGRLKTLSQEGWQMRYLSYTRSGGVDVPAKVFITSPSMDVKIMIYNWKLG